MLYYFMYERNGVRGKLMSNDPGSHLMLVELEYKSTSTSALYQESIGKCFVQCLFAHFVEISRCGNFQKTN